MAHAEIELALAELRPSFGGDGIDLSVGQLSDDGRVEIILSASDDACAECVVPDDVLIQVFDAAIREKMPELTQVTLTKIGFERLEAHA